MNKNIIMNIKEYFKGFSKIKSASLLYITFIIIASLFHFTNENYLYPKSEIIFIIFLSLIGILLLMYYSFRIDKLHYVTFAIILIFGLCIVLLYPPGIVYDETEHFYRAEMTSEGNLFPEYINNPLKNENSSLNGYMTIRSVDFSKQDLLTGKGYINPNWGTEKINNTPYFVYSAFSQNPFYGYLPQSIGIFIAKLLDLSNIWMLYLGRLCNLLLYGGICALAVKKAPDYKLPLMITACMPLGVYVGSSLSIDATINSFALLAIAYFIYMYKSPDKSLDWKNISVFSILILIVTFSKVTFLGLILLLLIPQNKFKNKKTIYYLIISFISICLIGLIWAKMVSPLILNSWRLDYMIEHNVNSTKQLLYLMNNPLNGLKNMIFSPNVNNLIIGIYTQGTIYESYTSEILSNLYLIFIVLVAIFYPKNIYLKNKTRIGILLIIILIITGTFLIQYLTWSPVGGLVAGVQMRYFIPLFALLPLVICLKRRINIDKIDLLIVTLIIGFLAMMVMLMIINIPNLTLINILF